MDETIELGVITFNRTPSVVFPIQELYKYLDEESAPKLHLNPRGRTHTGEAVLAALDAIDNRMKLLCDRLGSHTFVPVLFILTDGNPFFCENEMISPSTGNSGSLRISSRSSRSASATASMIRIYRSCPATAARPSGLPTIRISRHCSPVSAPKWSVLHGDRTCHPAASR